MKRNRKQGFPKLVRLLKSAEFDRVHHGNHFAADHVLVIKAAQSVSGQTRLGLSIGRKVGNAVVRNRWKRVIRDVFRKELDKLPGGLDLVIRPRKGAICDHEQISRSLPKLALRIHRSLRKTKNK